MASIVPKSGTMSLLKDVKADKERQRKENEGEDKSHPWDK